MAYFRRLWIWLGVSARAHVGPCRVCGELVDDDRFHCAKCLVW